MALERINISLAIPKPIFDALPLDKKIAFRNAVRWAVSHSVNINEGAANQEITTIAVHHTCYHDEGEGHPPCGVEQEI